jgi:hypothetical protein
MVNRLFDREETMEKASKDKLELDFEVEVLEDRIAPSIALDLAFLIRAGASRVLVRANAATPASTGIRLSPVATIVTTKP